MTVDDDAPVPITPDNAYLLNKLSQPTVSGISLDSDGNIDDNMGADQGGTLTFAAASGTPSGYTSGLATVYLYVSADGLTLVGSTTVPAAGTADDAEDATVLANAVFTAVLDPDNDGSLADDTYSFTLHKPIDVATTFNVNDGGYNFVGGNLPYVYFDDLNGENDVLLTPYVLDAGVYKPDSTVNTNANEGGIGGNSVGSGELMRVDFVSGLSETIPTIDDPAPTVVGSAGYSAGANQDHSITGHNPVNGAFAVFTAITGGAAVSDITIRAIDELPTDTTVGNGTSGPYGGGLPGTVDIIRTVLIVYDGVQGSVIRADGTTQTVTLDGVGGLPSHTFTVHFNAETVTVDDVVSNTKIAVFTTDGYTTVEYQWAAGQDFKIGGFGATTVEAEATTLEFDLKLTDADGDSVIIDDGLHIRLSPDNHIVQTGDDLTDDSLAVAAGDEGTLLGLGGADTLTGNTLDDILVGGRGGDTIDISSGGNDTMIWGPNDADGSTDTIIGFSNTNVSTTATGDVLDLSDLLSGETGTAANLTAYLDVTLDGTSTKITIDTNGSAPGGNVQHILLQGVDLVTAGGGEQNIIQTLLTQGNLKTDVI